MYIGTLLKLYDKKYRASTQIPLGSCSDSIYARFQRQLIKNKNDLLKLIKPKWPPQPRFQSHMKTDNTNRLTDPVNLYIYQVLAVILIIGGKLKF